MPCKLLEQLESYLPEDPVVLVGGLQVCCLLFISPSLLLSKVMVHFCMYIMSAVYVGTLMLCGIGF